MLKYKALKIPMALAAVVVTIAVAFRTWFVHVNKNYNDMWE